MEIYIKEFANGEFQVWRGEYVNNYDPHTDDYIQDWMDSSVLHPSTLTWMSPDMGDTPDMFIPSRQAAEEAIRGVIAKETVVKIHLYKEGS